MKKLLYIIILIPNILFGQKGIVATPKTNLFYAYLKNPLYVSYPNIPCNNLKLIPLYNETTIEKDSCLFYVTFRNFFAPSYKQKIVVLNTKDNSIIDTIIIPCKRYPEVEFKFLRDNYPIRSIAPVTPNQLSAKCETFDVFGISHKIDSFNIEFYRKLLHHDSTDYFSHAETLICKLTNKGDKFDDHVIQTIKKYSPPEDYHHPANIPYKYCYSFIVTWVYITAQGYYSESYECNQIITFSWME